MTGATLATPPEPPAPASGLGKARDRVVMITGLRVGATLSVIGAVVGELVGSDRGLGFLINVGRGQYDTALVFVVVFTLIALAVSLYGLVVLLEARLLDIPDDRRADVEMVKKLVHQRTRPLAMYRCTNCGFKARQFYWHCPACAAWETYSPRRTETPEGFA